jgi:ATP-binding cassette subfamily B protein
MKNFTLLYKILHIVTFKKRNFLLGIISSICNKLCDILPEILIGFAIDVIVNRTNSFFSHIGIVNIRYQLYSLGVLTALLWILESFFEYMHSLAWYRLALSCAHHLRLVAFHAIEEMDTNHLEKKSSGDMLHVITDDINQIQDFIAVWCNDVIQLIVNIVIMGTIFYTISPLLGFITSICIPVVIIVAYYFQNKLGALYEKVQYASSQLSSYCSYRLHGIITIKMNATEKYELKRFADQSNVYNKTQYNAYKIRAQYIPLVRMAIMIGFIGSMIVGGIYALNGVIPINWYASLVFLTQRFLWPFTSIAYITDVYQKTIASVKRINEIILYKNKIIEGVESLDIKTIKGDIAYKNISFGYTEDEFLFKNLSFTITAQKTVAFVGATGSGKSTFTKLLLRLYEISSGEITIDGKNIQTLTYEHLRKSIAVVSQDIYMVEGTIYDNIAYGALDISKEEIIKAAKIAHIHDYIEQLPQGYDTIVQEHGKNFSGGEKQRIVIARAIAKKTPIIIFDEATSALDNETERAFQESLLDLHGHCTIIIIAHRLSTVKHADMIFVFENGSIIEQGNHNEMLKAQGPYAQLWYSSCN